MRKLCVALAAALLTLACVAASAGDAPVRVLVNDRLERLNPPAIVRDGKTYVCILSISRALNAEVDWQEDSKTAVITVGNKRTRLHQSDTITISDLPYLPLKATGEAVGCSVEWDRSRRVVKITSEAAPPSCYG